jgi:hypothetical protein
MKRKIPLREFTAREDNKIYATQISQESSREFCGRRREKKWKKYI